MSRARFEDRIPSRQKPGFVKKTLVLPESVTKQIEDIVQANHGLTFSFIVSQALSAWLSNSGFITGLRIMPPKTVD